jgi:hypothetical protein
MPAADETPDGVVYDAADQLRYELLSPLTTIYARAYLVGRTIRRAPSLADEERGQVSGTVRREEVYVDGHATLIDESERGSSQRR